MINNKEKGVSLIIAFFVMTIIIAVVISLSILSYGQIKILRNISSSVSAFYLADSGVEKVLYYDRKIAVGDATRGLCSICQNSEDRTCLDIYSEDELNCSCQLNDGDGCEPEICNDCTVSFYTQFEDRIYKIISTVNAEDILEINSSGIFKNVGRTINVTDLPVE